MTLKQKIIKLIKLSTAKSIRDAKFSFFGIRYISGSLISIR